MRIVLFLIGAIAAIYLIVKGFKQVLEESKESIKAEQRKSLGLDDNDREEDDR